MKEEEETVFISLIYRAIESGDSTSRGFLKVTATDREMAMVAHGDELVLDGHQWRVTTKNADKNCFFFKSTPPHPASIANAFTYPPPTHLKEILKIDLSQIKEKELRGAINCVCGKKTFTPKYVGVVTDENNEQRVRPLRNDEGAYHCIEVECTNCQSNYSIFDRSLHGVTGMSTDLEVVNPPLSTWSCQECGETSHLMDVYIIGLLKQEALMRYPKMVSEENWQDAFSWMGIRITCSQCWFQPKSWTRS